MSEALTEQKSQKWAISLFTIGVFMAALDNGIISAALTTINESFSVSPSWGSILSPNNLQLIIHYRYFSDKVPHAVSAHFLSGVKIE